jgi:GTPase SAR1 family protein
MSRFVERIKLGIIGQSGVGKTHFLHGFLFGDPTRRKITATLAVEFY